MREWHTSDALQTQSKWKVLCGLELDKHQPRSRSVIAGSGGTG